MSEYNFDDTMNLFFDEGDDGQYTLPTEEEREAARKVVDAEAEERNQALDEYIWHEENYYP